MKVKVKPFRNPETGDREHFWQIFARPQRNGGVGDPGGEWEVFKGENNKTWGNLPCDFVDSLKGEALRPG